MGKTKRPISDLTRGLLELREDMRSSPLDEDELPEDARHRREAEIIVARLLAAAAVANTLAGPDEDPMYSLMDLAELAKLAI